MASKYSWSCKRSYKNGYVWHDLCEDDLVLSVHGNEYVLKGSELFEESTSIGKFSPVEDGRLHTPKALPEPPSSRSQVDSSSSFTMNRMAVTNHLPDDEPSPTAQHTCSSSVSPESSIGKNSSWNGSLSLTEYKIYKSDGQADASTQTDENISRASGGRETCTRGDCSLENESSESQENQAPIVKEASRVCQDSPACSSSASSSGGREDTFESLIRSDASKFNSFRILQEEELRAPSSTKIKVSNMLMQLISCGSISVKDHSFGLTSSYKPSFLHSRFLMLGDVDCLSENSRFMGLKLEDKEYFSGSLVETSMAKEGTPSFKPSASYGADRTAENQDPDGTPEETSAMGSKCIPQAIIASLLKQPRSESMRSPLSDGPRISSSRIDCSRNISTGNSSGRSERFTGPTSSKKQSKNSDLLKNEERMIKIEESYVSNPFSSHHLHTILLHNSALLILISFS
ncbi:hypothetical protein Leryth_000715 [Lithospermum erythrorhizon]|nr:hypothetical protein Leryth_000715 [Lithospermum erythrorhizon]